MCLSKQPPGSCGYGVGAEGNRRCLELVRDGAMDQGPKGEKWMGERGVLWAGLRAGLDLGVQDRWVDGWGLLSRCGA